MFKDELFKNGIDRTESSLDFETMMVNIKSGNLVLVENCFPYNFLRQMGIKSAKRMKCADTAAVIKLNSDFNWKGERGQYFWNEQYAVVACNPDIEELLVTNAYSCFGISKKDFLSLKRFLKTPKMYTFSIEKK